MLCPRCQKALVPQRLTGHSLVYNAHGCQSCGGLLLGPDQLKEAEAQERAALIELKKLPTAAAQQAPLQCPKCSVQMDKVVSFRDADVVMDVCPRCHHTWLDKGELEAIMVDGLGETIKQLFGGKKS
jgi:Zn-finger nucleic acid-binding protein